MKHKGARVEWLLSLEPNNNSVLPALIDNLSLDAGLRGAQFLTAAAPSDTMLFEILRRAGFSAYGWELFWQFFEVQAEKSTHKWEVVSKVEIPALKAFRNPLLPPVMRTIRALSNPVDQTLVLRMDGKLVAVADLIYEGSTAIVTPLISQDVDNPLGILQSLLHFCSQNTNKLYLRQTNATSWLESHLSVLTDSASERYECLVKYFTLRSKVSASEMAGAANPGRADPAIPSLQSARKQNHL